MCPQKKKINTKDRLCWNERIVYNVMTWAKENFGFIAKSNFFVYSVLLLFPGLGWKLGKVFLVSSCGEKNKILF